MRVISCQSCDWVPRPVKHHLDPPFGACVLYLLESGIPANQISDFRCSPLRVDTKLILSARGTPFRVILSLIKASDMESMGADLGHLSHHTGTSLLAAYVAESGQDGILRKSSSQPLLDIDPILQ